VPARAAATATRAAYAAAATAAVALAGLATGPVANATGLHRPATLCLLRATTGVPCPLCGTTTALARLAGGDLLGALAANPVTLLAMAAFVVAPLVGFRLPRRATPALFTVLAGFAWVWQIVRFDPF